MTVLLGLSTTVVDQYDNFGNPNQAIVDNFVGLADGVATEAVLDIGTAGRLVKIIVYDASRNLLSETEFTTVSGINTVTLATPVNIVAGQTYYLGTISGSYWQIGRDSGSGSRFWSVDTSSTYPTVPNPHVQAQTGNERDNLFYLQGASGLSIDSTDAGMQRGTDFQVVGSNPATTPSTSDTLSNGNDTLTASSVVEGPAGTWTWTFPVGDLSKQVDSTGYDWTLTVDAETDTTGNIPLTIQAGYTLVNLTSPDTTNASLLFGVTGDTPITGDDLEYDVTSTLDSGVSFSVANDGVWTVTEATEGDWVTDITVDRRVVQADGTIGTTATLTLSASTGTVIGIISDLVTDMVTDLVTEMVN